MEIHYKRFVTETKPVDHQHEVRIYADTERKPLLEEFTITVGKELLIGDDPEIDQFVKDYIDSEIKELRKLTDEAEGVCMKLKYARKQQEEKNRDRLKPQNPDTKRVQNRSDVKRVQVPRRIQKCH